MKAKDIMKQRLATEIEYHKEFLALLEEAKNKVDDAEDFGDFEYKCSQIIKNSTSDTNITEYALDALRALVNDPDEDFEDGFEADLWNEEVVQHGDGVH